MGFADDGAEGLAAQSAEKGVGIFARREYQVAGLEAVALQYLDGFGGNIAAARDMLGSGLGLLAGAAAVVILGMWLRNAMTAQDE